MGGGRDVVNGLKGQGSEGARVMEDRLKWMEGKKGSTEPVIFIMGAMPNQQSEK